MKSKARRSMSLQPRLRILFGDDIAIGPGKAELLRMVRQTGSILGAARQMEMSYMRAWSLIRTMNQCFREPVIFASRGGKEFGGAKLTATGEELLSLYEQLEQQCLASTEATRAAIARLLKSNRSMN